MAGKAVRLLLKVPEPVTLTEGAGGERLGHA